MGDFALLANDLGGIYLINVSDPANPVKFAFQDLPGRSHDIAPTNDYLCLADGTKLRLLDIKNPLDPAEVSLYELKQQTYGIAAVGHHAYLTLGESGLVVVDISDPHSPEVVSNFDIVGLAQGIDIEGEFAYIAAGDAGLVILRLPLDLLQ